MNLTFLPLATSKDREIIAAIALSSYSSNEGIFINLHSPYQKPLAAKAAEAVQSTARKKLPTD